MAELLASNQDVNGWLANDKLEATDVNSAPFQIDAQRLIRGQLASSFTPVILSGWINPATTPEQIRAIAGRLIAAFLYRKTYSEESLDIPQYAQELYDEAIAMLTDIKMGNTTLIDVGGNPIDDSAGLSVADFWPNNNTEGPYFTMSQKFG